MATPSEKILGRLRGLRTRMQEDEVPLFSIPVIWENGTERRSTACDLVLTNQRLFGYIYNSFPRERLFMDTLDLDCIRVVSLRHKSHSAMFRELFVSDGQKKIYLRATRKKIEEAYSALRDAIEQYAPVALMEGRDAAQAAGEGTSEKGPRSATVYGRQEIHQPLERSPLGVALLFTGGLLLEVIGVLVWAATGSLATGLPIFLAGIVAVVTAFFIRRQPH